MSSRQCTHPGCERRRRYKLYCNRHYVRAREGRPMEDRQPKEFCDVPGCPRPHLAKGYCNTHYQRVRQGKPFYVKPSGCSVSGCGRPHSAHGLCKTHDDRKKKGDPNWARPIRERMKDGQRLGGFVVPADAVEEVAKQAVLLGMAPYRVIQHALKEWARAFRDGRDRDERAAYIRHAAWANRGVEL